MASPAADELRFLAGALKQAGAKTVLAELRDALRDAAGPAAEAARQAILAVPARHERELRRGIADHVKITTALGTSTARVTITATGPDRWPRAALLMEKGKWNHPVFARGDLTRWEWTWRTQYGPAGWFDDAVSTQQAGFDRAVDDVTDRIERRLAGEP